MNVISIDKEKDDILPELLLEMGVALGLDLDKPVTTAVYVLSNTENIKDITNIFKKKN